MTFYLLVNYNLSLLSQSKRKIMSKNNILNLNITQPSNQRTFSLGFQNLKPIKIRLKIIPGTNLLQNIFITIFILCVKFHYNLIFS